MNAIPQHVAILGLLFDNYVRDMHVVLASSVGTAVSRQALERADMSKMELDCAIEAYARIERFGETA